MKTKNSLTLLMVVAALLTLSSCNKETPASMSSTSTENQTLQVAAQGRGIDSMHQIYQQLQGRDLNNYVGNLDYPSMEMLSADLASQINKYMLNVYSIDAYSYFESTTSDPNIIRDNMVMLGLIYSFLENVNVSAIDVSDSEWFDELSVRERCFYDAISPLLPASELQDIIHRLNSGTSHATIVEIYASHMNAISDILPTFDAIYKLGICATWWN